ncbi:MAG: tetratricopeptide repeat protein [Candidatus Hodarchaeales archaeon]|jgi:tetratricopeptide (TPR) repeat protein
MDEQKFLLEDLPSITRTPGEFLQVMFERAVKGLEESNTDSKALAVIVSMLSALLGKSISLSNDAALASIKKVDVWGAIQRFRKESSSIALESLEELLVIAQREEDTILRLDALQAMSFVLSRSGQYEKAEETIMKLLDTLDSSKVITHQSYLLAVMNMQGWILRATGKVNESRNLLRFNVILARASHYDYHFADALSNLGITYWTTGKFDSALVVLEEALALRKDLDDLVGQAAVLNNLAMIHRKKGSFEKAQGYYEACLEIDQTLGNLQGVAISQGNLANILAQRGALQEARQRLEEVLELKEKLEDKQGAGITHQSQAEVLREMGNLQEAEEHINRSIAIKQDLGDKTGLAASYRSLAEIHCAQGDYNSALEHLNRAFGLEKRVGNQWGEAATLSIYGKIHYLQGNLEAAKESLYSAIRIQDQLGTWESLDSRRMLAVVLGECGETDEALGLLEKVRVHSKDRISEYARYLVAKAIILSRVGHPSKEILSYFWEAIEIGKKIGLTIEDVFQAYLGIAAHFLGRGQYDAARDLLMQASDASREHFPIVAQVQVLESLMASSQFEFDFAEELLKKSRTLVLQRRMGRRLLSDIDTAEQTIEKTRGSLKSLEKLSPVIEGEVGNLEQVSLDEALRYIETLQDRYLSRQR